MTHVGARRLAEGADSVALACASRARPLDGRPRLRDGGPVSVDLPVAGDTVVLDDQSCWEELRRGLWEHSVKFAEGVDPLGRRLSWLVDCRETLLTARYLRPAGRLMWSRVRRYAPELVGGLTMGADSLTAAVLTDAADHGHSIGGFAVRRRRKRHGLRRLIEGRQVRPGSRVVLLDDVLSSGASLLRAYRAVTEAGGTVVAAVVLVNYRRPGTAERFARLGVPVEAVFTLSDLGLDAQPPSDAGAARPAWRFPGVLASTARILQ